MPPRSRLAVVLPTFDERPNILAALDGVLAAAPDARIIVIDDDSPDGTADLARSWRGGRAEVVLRGGARGLRESLFEGFRRVLADGADVIVTMDCDGSHDATTLPALVTAVHRGADLAIGSRYTPGGAVLAWPLRRRVLSRGGNVYAGWLLGLPVADATSGFRAYRGELLEELMRRPLRARGYAFQVETVHRTIRLGGSVVEVPIVFTDRVAGRSKMSPWMAVEAAARIFGMAFRDRRPRVSSPSRKPAKRGLPTR